MSTGRPLKYDPDQALEQAMQTFWALGYEAASMQALLGAMGLSKSSLYQRFGDKAQLFERCLRHYCAEQSREMRRRLNAAESPLDFITNSFYAVVDDPEASRARWGCLLMNTATELGATDPALSEALQCARYRKVFGKTLDRQPLMVNVLADLALEMEVSVVFFRPRSSAHRLPARSRPIDTHRCWRSTWSAA